MVEALKNRRGEGYIDVCVSLLVIIMVVVLALNVFSFLTLKMDMDYFAREMIDAATMSGNVYSSTVVRRYNELTDEVGFAPAYSWNAAYYSGGKVQYGNTIQITLTYNTHIAGLGIGNFPITLKARYSGLSQEYWK